MSKKNIVFVTGNVNKLEEVLQVFKTLYNGNVPFNLINKDIDLPELQGESDEVCKKKAQTAFELIKTPCIVEDTSLCFNAMGGLPGIYIKWFLKKLGPHGLHRMLTGFEDKSAKAVCSFAYINETGVVNLFVGETNGTIVSPTVPETFGWDSCFKPDGYEVTYAEMSKEQKNLISHRMKAIHKLKDFLDKNM